MPSPGPQLLVSVRDSLEAEAALSGGADLIDVKEPARGSLGRADEANLDAIRNVVAGRRPVSAALGELCDFDRITPRGFDYVKCGLANIGFDWRTRWSTFQTEVSPAAAVIVAYADWRCAVAPDVEDVIAFACERPGAVLLIDTCCKDKNIQGRRATLLDWLPLPDLRNAIERIHQARGRIALAGSLSLASIAQIRELEPDWIAVRGAACADNDRKAGVDRERVRQIKNLLQGNAAD
jgi:uncharacterized protein (UPF0264 family)